MPHNSGLQTVSDCCCECGCRAWGFEVHVATLTEEALTAAIECIIAESEAFPPIAGYGLHGYATCLAYDIEKVIENITIRLLYTCCDNHEGNQSHCHDIEPGQALPPGHELIPVLVEAFETDCPGNLTVDDLGTAGLCSCENTVIAEAGWSCFFSTPTDEDRTGPICRSEMECCVVGLGSEEEL